MESGDGTRADALEERRGLTEIRAYLARGAAIVADDAADGSAAGADPEAALRDRLTALRRDILATDNAFVRSTIGQS